MSALSFYDLHTANPERIATELIAGLVASTAFTSPKYLYDALGSRLFDAITELPEYYPTRTEASIFKTYATEIAATLPKGSCLMDFGAGSCSKAISLFSSLQPASYVALDISTDYLREVLTAISQRYDRIKITGVGIDFAHTLDLPTPLLANIESAPLVAFYPGSSIGNFSPDEALAFLQRVQQLCLRAGSKSGILIGVDLVKPIAVLEAAYDDPLGLTGAFNLNLLRHINKLIGANFDVRDWQHIGLFNTSLSRIEMHVEAKKTTTVSWCDNLKLSNTISSRTFQAGERIHTENSYKWTPDNFTSLLQTAGFSKTKIWTDDANYFAVFWAEP
jgi:L-histidine Nalpha-methyltransferase